MSTPAAARKACPGLPKRYDMKDSKILGDGYFGVVRSAFDTRERKQVAVKRIDASPDCRGHLVDVLKLIRAMKLLGSHPHIVELIDISTHQPTDNIYVIVSTMDTTLSRILKSRQALTEEHFQYFSLQLLEAVKAMHAIGIVHTDLKPDHIYLTKNCDLRIGGFRSVQLEGTVHDCNDHRREYGLTRWYRSPEILLNTMMPYAPSMDMFTVGCILGEMYMRLPLFPGSDYIDQITRICKFTGYAEHEDIGVGDLVPRTQAFLHKHCIFPKADLKATFPTAGAQALSLLDALLQLNPARRITAAQALQHEYFAEIEGPYDCSKASLTRPRADYFAFELDRMDEQQRLTCAQLQGLIDEELKCYATEPDSTLDPLYLPLSCR